MADDFSFHPDMLDSPASNAETVDISTTDHVFTKTPRGLYVGVSGAVKVDMARTGSGVTFTALPVGFHPIRVTKVYQTGTTATNIVGVW